MTDFTLAYDFFRFLYSPPVRLEAGADLVIGDLDHAEAKRAAADLARNEARHTGARLNVGDHVSIAALADLAMETTGRLDIWVNNVGIYPSRLALEITDDEWDQVLNVNLHGTFLGASEAALRMQPSRGVIVNIASTAAFNASDGANPAHYVASKHGVAGLTKSLAVELGTKGIRVVAVAPTLTETPGVANKRQQGENIREALIRYGQMLPLGRLGVPDDIARAVLYAASDLSVFVTGSIISVDGGDIAR